MRHIYYEYFNSRVLIFAVITWPRKSRKLELCAFALKGEHNVYSLVPNIPVCIYIYWPKVNLYQVVFSQQSVRTLFKFTISDQYHNFNFVNYFTKWLLAAILDVQNSLSMVFLAISDQYETFLQNGRRRPFWMSEIHLWSHFWPFQIDMQLNVWKFLTKWLPSTILDVRNSLSIAFLAILVKYGLFLQNGHHFGCPKFTFDWIIWTLVWILMRMVDFIHDSDKHDDWYPYCQFPISYLSSNIPESPAYGVFVSQLIRYDRVCWKYEDFLFRLSILISKWLSQGFFHIHFTLLLGNSMVVIQGE